jgi:hypothetical protein
MFRLMWNFDNSYYSPSEKATVSLWAINEGNEDVYISEVEFNFDFGIYMLPQTISGIIPTPNSGLSNTAFLGKVELTIPPRIAGIQKFSVRYILYRLKAGQFVPRAVVSSKKFILNIIATPIYRIFLPRGISFEDRIVSRMRCILLPWLFSSM